MILEISKPEIKQTQHEHVTPMAGPSKEYNRQHNKHPGLIPPHKHIDEQAQVQDPVSELPVRQCIQDYVTNKPIGLTGISLNIRDHCHTKSQIQKDPKLSHLLRYPPIKDLYKDRPLVLLDGSNYSMARSPQGQNISIGKGTHGEIILARDETTKQLVCVKVSNERLQDIVIEFGYQTKAHNILGKNAPSFKGLLQVRQDSPYGAASGFRYLPVMEFCSLTSDSPVALTLREALILHQQGHKFFSANEWFQICRQIFVSVYCLANGKLHHCDLKLNNILLRFEGDSVYPVIIDYGLAMNGSVNNNQETLLKPITDSQILNLYPHTPPEMFKQNYLLPTSDLHSVAYCILHINESVFRSKLVKREMKAYMKMSPQDRHDFPHFLSTVEDILSVYV